MTLLEFFEKLGFENPRFDFSGGSYYVVFYNKDLERDYSLIYMEIDNFAHFLRFNNDKDDEKTLKSFIQEYKGKYLIYYVLDKNYNYFIPKKIKIPDELEFEIMFY